MTDREAERSGFIRGLRKLADLMEQHPEIPPPFYGHQSPLLTYFHGDKAREEMAAARKAIGGTWDKVVDDDYLKLTTSLDGLRLQLYATRDNVCTRHVVGTEVREVEEEVTPAVTQKVMREMPVVEWRCGSILGEPAEAEPE